MQLLQHQKSQPGLIDPFLNNLGDMCEDHIRHLSSMKQHRRPLT